MYIRIDDREPKQMKELLLRHKAEVTYERLKVGDYLFADICIERKTTADLLASVRDQRIWTQLKACKENYPRVFLLLEGSLPVTYDKKTAVDESIAISTLAGVSMGWGIPIIPSSNLAQTAKIIDTMYRRCDKKKTEYLKPIKKKKAKDINEMKENVLGQVPGVSRKTARIILKEYGTIAKVAEISAIELRKLPGVGKVTSERIQLTLNT